jgi:hypothetical protein
MNQLQQRQQFHQRSCNKNQHTRKAQFFKRKHRKSNKCKHTISNEANDLLKQVDRKEMVQQSPTLLIVPSSSTKKPFYSLHIVSSIDPYELLPNYSTMSNTNFQQMLSTLFLAYYDKDSCKEFLGSEEKVTFIRRTFELINKLNYIKLKDEQ